MGGGQSSEGEEVCQDSEPKDKETNTTLEDFDNSVDPEMTKVVTVAEGQGEEIGVRGSPAEMDSSNSMLSESHPVFSNPVILDKIFDFHPSARNIRLVTKCWNDVVLSGKSRLTLKLHSIPFGENTDEFEPLIDTLDSRLVKRVVANLYTKYLTPNFLYICEKLGHNIQEITVNVSLDKVAILYQILDSTPNIRTLSISVRHERESLLPPPSANENEIVPIIPIKPKLNAIRFDCSPQEKDWIQSFSMISPFFGSLLAAAPKLKKLEVFSFFCPTLESNKELRYFRFYSTSKNLPGNDDGSSIQYLNLNNLPQILGGVKDSLEIFKVGAYMEAVDATKYLEIPPMPKLKVLINGSNCNDALGINCNLRELWKDRMPSLIQLKIDQVGARIRQRKKILNNIITFRNDGIKRLGLIGVDEGSTLNLSDLKMIFPSLERLDLLLDKKRSQDEWACSRRMGKVLKSCSTLGLAHLRIQTEFSYVMSYMVEALWECRDQLLPGLKTLELINRDEMKYLVRDDLNVEDKAKFQEILMQSKEMKSVVFNGILLRFGHAKILSDFISDNKLPVIFLND